MDFVEESERISSKFKISRTQTERLLIGYNVALEPEHNSEFSSVDEEKT